MPYLARIDLYPFKSLNPLPVQEAKISPTGALAHDREFALFDEEGKYVNGKRAPLVYGLHAAFSLATGGLCLTQRDTGRERHFYLPDDQTAIDAWLTDYFGKSITLRRNPEGGFPDDRASPGPTLISTATLEEVASWFPDLSVESARVRFRTNLEIADCPPFWEDRLFDDPDMVVPFEIGGVTLHGVNPCQRCVVPPRDPQTGEPIPDFSPIFRERREAALPPWANRSRFNHFYRLAVNTRIPSAETGKFLRLGDPVRLLSLG